MRQSIWTVQEPLTGHFNVQPVIVLLGLAALVLLLLYKMIDTLQLRMKPRTVFTYIPLSEATKKAEGTVVLVDCSAIGNHPTLTHHKSNCNPKKRAGKATTQDTSTGIVLDSIKAGFFFGGDAYRHCQCPAVSTNHFDIDSFLSVWAYCNRPLALANESVLRHMARIADFREGFLTPELVHEFGHLDGITNIRDCYTALKLCCVINTLEKQLFSAPYASKDCDAKMAYFLDVFSSALTNPESHWQDWQDEYKQVTSGFDQLLLSPDCSVQLIKKLGFAVIQCPEPLHYYSLFSHTLGADVVLTMYDKNRYELECKYTQYIQLQSRPVWPRLDMAPLVQVLNVLELGARGPLKADNVGVGPVKGMAKSVRSLSSGGPLSTAAVEAARDADAAAAAAAAREEQGAAGMASSAAITAGTDVFASKAVAGSADSSGGMMGSGDGRAAGAGNNSNKEGEDVSEVAWVADRMTDTGPILRLEPKHAVRSGRSMLTKAQRYGHPCDRPFLSSSIPPPVMLAVVQSFLEFGLKGTHPKQGGWSWEELHAINDTLPMHTWVQTVLDQAASGAFSLPPTVTTAVSGTGSSNFLSPPLSPRMPSGPESHAIPLEPPMPIPQGLVPHMQGGPSSIVSSEDVAALVCGGALPARHAPIGGASRPWRLTYCTRQHGISLATLYRRAANVSPTLLFIKDTGGGVFGAYCSEPWRVGPRFYGSGETCVFQLYPRRVLYPWQRLAAQDGRHIQGNNSYFQFGTHRCGPSSHS
uniref:Oxidation resistance protein 1 n=1 Tax=Dunaliella tertiolecta TaxID=3047 RepID=A0A7S3R957_DUNTE